jgi:hypothetical protein
MSITIEEVLTEFKTFIRYHMEDLGNTYYESPIKCEDLKLLVDELETLRAQLAEKDAMLGKCVEALKRIAGCADAPDIDAIGDWQKGLHCGVEDRECRDRYDGADYGHTVGVERALEWASNEAKHALASLPTTQDVIAKVRNEALEEAKQACLSRISDDGKCFDVQEKMDCEDHEAFNCSKAIEALKTEEK